MQTVLSLLYVVSLIGLPVAAVTLLVQDLRGTRTGRLNAAKICAVAGAGLWSLNLGALWIFAHFSPAWLALPVAFGAGVGGTCAWRQRSGWRLWVALAEVAFATLAPPVLIAIVAPGFSRAFDKSRSWQAIQAAVPSGDLAQVAARLKDPDPFTRAGAAHTLAQSQKGASAFLAELGECLDDKEADVRGACADALAVTDGPGIALLRARLPRARPEALEAIRLSLERAAPADPAEALAFARLADDRTIAAPNRAVAAWAVSQFRPLPYAAAPVVLEALKDPDAEVRRSALSTLTILRAGLGEEVAARASDSDALVRSQAFYAIAASTPVPVSRLPLLLKGMQDEDRIARSAATAAMNELAAFPPEAVAALLKAVDDSDRGTRWRAMSGLGRAREQAAPAVERLRKVVREEEPKFEGMMAVDALGRIGPAAAAALPDVRDFARRAPGLRHIVIPYYLGIGEAGHAALPDLIDWLQHGDDTLRNNAAHALGEMGAAAAPALPYLEQAKSDKAFGVSYLAGRSIEKIRADRRSAEAPGRP